MPDTTQRNSKECCIWTCSHVHAGMAMTISENNGKCRLYLQSKNRQIRWQKDKEKKTIFTSHERSRSQATNTISTWNFLMVVSGKTIFQSYFPKHGAVNEFYGAIDISHQIRGAEFPVIRVLEKPKLLHSGTCTSTSTRHVNLKSPLLLQFPYCKLCDNDNKQSNCRLMNFLVLYKCPISWF